MNKIPINNLHLFTKNNSGKGLSLLNCEVFYILYDDNELITANRIYHPVINDIMDIADVLVEGIEVCWKDNPFELNFTGDNYIRKIKPN